MNDSLVSLTGVEGFCFRAGESVCWFEGGRSDLRKNWSKTGRIVLKMSLLLERGFKKESSGETFVKLLLGIGCWQ